MFFMEGHKPHSFESMPLIAGAAVYHYTCNPPSYSFLDRSGIEYVGDAFGCADPREVLRIPFSFLEEEGVSHSDRALLVLGLENLFARVE